MAHKPATNSRDYNLAFRHTSGVTRTIYILIELEMILIVFIMVDQ